MSVKKKVYLIDLGTGTDRSLLPLGCGLIASYCSNNIDIANYYDLNIMMLDKGIEDLSKDLIYPDVIGFACYCWNFYGCVELTKIIKEMSPETLIVWGGPSVPSLPHRIKEFMESYNCVDVLVHGEGEITFSEILLNRINKKSLAFCNGITFRNKDSYITTFPRERIKDFTQIPSPFLNGTFDIILKKYGKQIVGALWETSRGCPFQCSFCDWGSALVNKVTRLEKERVLKEIQWISDNKIHYVYATDANFGITVQRDLEISQGFVDISKTNGYPNTLILNWTKNSHKNIVRIAETLFKGNVATNVTLSYQSFHEPVLKAISRGNIKLRHLYELKKEFHSRRISTYGELILGLPEETLSTFINGLDQSLTPNIYDQLSIYLCCIIVNTKLYEEKEKYRIETRKCAVGLNRRRFKFERFGVDEIVVSTNTMPIDDWKRAYEIAFTTCSLYNLRVAFFVMIFLKHQYGAPFSDFVKFVLDIDKSKLPIFGKAIDHVRKNRQLILDSKFSVSPIEGSEGVSFTPHEAMTFVLLNNFDETYQELESIVIHYCKEKNYDINPYLHDIMMYQKARMPVFKPDESPITFNSNVPRILDCLIIEQNTPELEFEKTTCNFKHPKHSYKDQTEFNRRRVSCGYSIAIADVIYARNTNLEGKFERKMDNTNQTI